MKFLNNKVLILLSVILAFGTAELGLRIFGFYPRQDRYQVYEFDSRLGWKPKVSSRGYKTNLDVQAETYWDRMGYVVHKNEWERIPDEGRHSIGWVGDSFVEGRYTNYEDHFVYQYHKKNPQFQSLNIGVGGYSPEQMLLRARELLTKMRVRKVFFILFAHNDLPFLDEPFYYHEGFPKPKMDSEFQKILNSPLKEPKTPEKTLLKKLAGRSSLANLFRHFLKDEKSEEVQVFKREKWERLFQLMSIMDAEVRPKKFHIHYLPYVKEGLNREVLSKNLSNFYEFCKKSYFICSDFSQTWKKGEDITKYYLPHDQHLSPLGLKQLSDFFIGYDDIINQ